MPTRAALCLWIGAHSITLNAPAQREREREKSRLRSRTHATYNDVDNTVKTLFFLSPSPRLFYSPGANGVTATGTFVSTSPSSPPPSPYFVKFVERGPHPSVPLSSSRDRCFESKRIIIDGLRGRIDYSRGECRLDDNDVERRCARVLFQFVSSFSLSLSVSRGRLCRGNAADFSRKSTRATARWTSINSAVRFGLCLLCRAECGGW